MKSKKILVLRYLLWTAVLALMIVIFIFSSKTAEQSSSSSGSFAKTLLSFFVPGFTDMAEAEQQAAIDGMQFFVRKGAHFAVYFALGALCLFAMNTYNIGTGKKTTVSLIISLAYAISDEIHQLYVPGRAGQIRDVLIDFSGALVGVGLALLIILIFHKIKEKRGKS